METVDGVTKCQWKKFFFFLYTYCFFSGSSCHFPQIVWSGILKISIADNWDVLSVAETDKMCCNRNIIRFKQSLLLFLMQQQRLKKTHFSIVCSLHLFQTAEHQFHSVLHKCHFRWSAGLLALLVIDNMCTNPNVCTTVPVYERLSQQVTKPYNII